ncbi:hypothetical protein PCANC_01764 [Puccinia coronata f. sp. avenae]|uniref:Uncharacterized protein n=1 Tax=Puccinia coronata f. sp. avenae TaxID=200324 RepID=A0A2N5W5B5_9BASI|nr:hypothetical protein PCANC_01764 [Puccinia coronata f. sp. avenae]
MAPSVFLIICISSWSLLLLSDRNLVSGKVFTCEQSLAPVTHDPVASTNTPEIAVAVAPAPAPTAAGTTTISPTATPPRSFVMAPILTALPPSMIAANPTAIPPSMIAANPGITGKRLSNTPGGLSAPVKPFSSTGPLPTKELACKSELEEKTFAFCVAKSCTGTATCEGCWSAFGMMAKVKCMAYNIQPQRNFCQDINGIKFLCVGRCVARTENLRRLWYFISMLNL